MRRIASRQNAIVARYREAARGEREGVLLLDGAHLVEEALAAGLRIREAAVAVDATTDPRVRTLAERLDERRVDTVEVTAPVLAALSPVRSASPIVALAEQPQTDTTAFDAADALIAVAVDIQDPGNVGAIVRVAEAAGATGVVAAGASADPFGWKALRGSMGSALRVPILVHKQPQAVADLRARRFRIVATAPRGGRPLFDAKLTGRVALLIGGEGGGLSSEALAAADELVTIPMAPPVESLNAAVTAALVLYEALRQRSVAPAIHERA